MNDNDTIDLNNKVERLENALEQEKRRHVLLLQSMVDGVYTTDTDKHITFWNEGAERITGYSAEEAIGSSCRELLGHVDEDGLQLCDMACPLTMAMDKEVSLLGKDVYSNTKSGEIIPVSVSCSPLKDEHGNVAGAVEVFRDISEKKKLEEQKKRFFQMLTHDLKSPLSAIIGFADLLLMEADFRSAEDIKLDVNVIKNNAESMKSIITDFLTLAKLESSFSKPNREEVSLQDLISKLTTAHAHEAERKKISLSTRLDPGLMTIEFDKRMMERAIANLVTNAIKYTHQGGSVEITADVNGNFIELSVTDNGRGIPESDHGKVFDMFYRCEDVSDVEGTGLGLPLVKAVADAHGGSVRVENGPGGGSRFTISLPLSPVPPKKT